MDNEVSIKIGVIIPVYNRRETTLNCLDQLKNKVVTDGGEIQVVVVDDGSTDGTADAIYSSYPDVKILKGDGNLWWTGAINKGIEYALGQELDYALIINDDLEFDRNFLVEMLEVAKIEPTGLISSIKLNKLKNGDEKIIAVGFNVVGLLREIKRLHADELYQPEKFGNVLNCDILTGASLLIPMQVFRQIGIFDGKNFPHHWGDFEFTRRASIHGFKCLVATKSKIYADYNQNYVIPYLIRSTKEDFVKSLFNNTRYYHGFVSVYKSSFMHKNPVFGGILFCRRLFGLMKMIFLKIVLPNQILKKIYQK